MRFAERALGNDVRPNRPEYNDQNPESLPSQGHRSKSDRVVAQAERALAEIRWKGGFAFQLASFVLSSTQPSSCTIR